MVSITVAELDYLHDQLSDNPKFVTFQSLDNRTIVVRKDAILDVYFSSDDYDDYGPEEYEPLHGLYPYDDFWDSVEDQLCSPEEAPWAEQIDPEIIINLPFLTDAQIDILIGAGMIPAEEREDSIEMNYKHRDWLEMRATKVIIQYTKGKIRIEQALDSDSVYDLMNSFELEDPDQLAYFPTEGYHRSIFINKGEIDYISVPTHKYQEGRLGLLEESLGYLDEEQSSPPTTQP